MMGHRRNIIVKLCIVVILILLIYSAYVTYLYYTGIMSGYAGSASVQINILESPTLIQHLNISLNRPLSRVAITVPVDYIGNNTTNTMYSALPGHDQYYTTVFGGLYPHTTYTIIVNGSEQPYCRVGQMCPDYILAVHRAFNITTGAPFSTENITLNT